MQDIDNCNAMLQTLVFSLKFAAVFKYLQFSTFPDSQEDIAGVGNARPDNILKTCKLFLDYSLLEYM